jgi:predicted molibdopterin-dependent oxidoreductase YjgC
VGHAHNDQIGKECATQKASSPAGSAVVKRPPAGIISDLSKKFTMAFSLLKSMSRMSDTRHNSRAAHPGILHVDRFVSGVRAPLIGVTHEGTSENTSPKYPFVLTTGRSLYEFNASTMTGRCRPRELRPTALFATFHTAATFLNAVTGPYADRATDTPEYKVRAVRIEKV